MSQYIDFYDDSLKPQKDVYGIHVWVYTQIGAVGLALLVMIFKIAAWQSTRVDLATIEIQHRSEQEQLSKTKRMYPSNEVIASLESNVARQQELSAELGSIVNGLRYQNQYDSKGFSRQMKALAQYTASGIQLQGLGIRRGGQDILLSGAALEPTSIFKTIRSLNQADIFKGQTFRAIKLEESDAITSFSLTSLPFTEGDIPTNEDDNAHSAAEKKEQQALLGDESYKHELLTRKDSQDKTHEHNKN